ncbi:hypothetical protein H6P81_012346 [Aristolochia fimbriata]|uniref:BHLH domain-containing protein n=1 Tax=Aristolochia fimbriata TaxID=158543 RepID=A0AAV7EBV9_ARIFI|nr:hypothetical protein H6P81_012346 [Aristolochia fimbriata]
MAAFSYQHHPSLLDSFLSNDSTKMASLPEEGMNAASFSFYPLQTLRESSSLENPTKVAVDENQVDSLSSIALKTDSSYVVDGEHSSDRTDPLPSLVDRKRKSRDHNTSTCAESKEGKETKGKKQNKGNASPKQAEEKKPRIDKKNTKKASEDPPTGYIHVRARRGQATDSHSLAERVRREKISERMKLLQGLVPGCDKVTGKALMLDEIINYVQSLQNQVEFLSMKLASVNPVFYDFSGSVDFDDCMTILEKPRNLPPSQVPSLQQSNHTLQTNFADSTATSFAAANNYPLLENTSVFVSGQGHQNSFSQDNANILWDMGGQRQSFLNPTGYNNLCSFQ